MTRRSRTDRGVKIGVLAASFAILTLTGTFFDASFSLADDPPPPAAPAAAPVPAAPNAASLANEARIARQARDYPTAKAKIAAARQLEPNNDEYRGDEEEIDALVKMQADVKNGRYAQAQSWANEATAAAANGDFSTARQKLDAVLQLVDSPTYRQLKNSIESQERLQGWGENGDRVPGTRKTLTIGDSTFVFRWAPAGTFTMGKRPSCPIVKNASDPNEDCDEPKDDGKTFGKRGRLQYYDSKRHDVTLTRGFWLMETEITQEMWRRATGTNPSSFSADGLDSGSVEELPTSRFPVERVGWEDCAAFIEKLNADPALPPELKFCLPTEAQWEYACRAGSTSAFYFGETPAPEDANFLGACPAGRPTTVKTFPPNAWGFYDMCGNVAEWVEDWYSESYFYTLSQASTPALDPVGAGAGSGKRVVRGGSWRSLAAFCESGFRAKCAPDVRSESVGFRLALKVEEPKEPEDEAAKTPK